MDQRQRDLRKALCMGGVFAVSTVLPEKIQRLAADLEAIRQFVPGNALDHALQELGCFLLLLASDLGYKELNSHS